MFRINIRSKFYIRWYIWCQYQTEIKMYNQSKYCHICWAENVLWLYHQQRGKNCEQISLTSNRHWQRITTYYLLWCDTTQISSN